MEGAVVAALEHHPEALQAIGVRLSVHPTGDGVLTGGVVPEAVVGVVLVREGMKIGNSWASLGTIADVQTSSSSVETVGGGPSGGKKSGISPGASSPPESGSVSKSMSGRLL